MKIEIENWVPAGIDYRQELRWIGIAVAAGGLYSLGVLWRINDQYQELFTMVGDEKVLIQGAVMEDFANALANGLGGFFIVALCMVILAAYQYLYHYQGSRSIYLMKRLPGKWELLKRCATLPLVSAAIVLILAGMFLLLYFGIYIIVTPPQCFVPGQWMRIFS